MDEAAGALVRHRAELGRTVPCRGRFRVSAALPGPFGGSLQGGGDVLVGSGGRRRTVPGLPVGSVGQRRGRGQMCLSPLLRCGGVVERGADQRMMEADTA
ncbi:hypothetical protein RB199_25150 [Streptomyces libani]